jgi:ABC-type Zn uptake system ZnuABC Zn-binding protein ZnuA
MKIPLALLFALAVLCASGLWGQRPVVVATTTMIADMASHLAGPHLEVRSLMPVGGDPHLYEPTPSDAVVLSNADLLLRNGLGLEGWLDPMLRNTGKSIPLATVTDGILPIRSADHHGAPDPHAWMDVRLAKQYAANISRAFEALDPGHAADFRQRLSAYSAELDSLDAEVRLLVSAVPDEQRVLITSHDAFHYFANAYGFEVDATMGTSTDAEARTIDIARLGDAIRRRGLRAIFVESTVNPQLLEQLARDHGIAIGGKLYADSLGEPGTEAGTYVGMVRHNARTIVAGLLGVAGPPEQSGSGPLGWWPFAALGALVAFGVLFLLRNHFRKDDLYA